MNQLALFDVEELEEKETYFNWVLIDGNNLMNRCYHATANQNMTAPDGRPTNAVQLFVKMMLNYQKQYQANLAVFFDKGKGFRKKLYPEYKDGRKPKDDRLKLQFPLIREILTAAAIPYFWNDELEADDIISSACNSLPGHKYVISNDADLLQVIRDDVSVIVRKKKDDVIMTPEVFRTEWDGLEPKQVVDIKALAGDSSDNIPGVVGIGDVGAFKLIKHFGKVENISLPFPKELKSNEKKFGEGVLEKAIFWKKLTTLVSNTPLQIKEYEINKKGLIAICEQLAMKSVINFVNKA